VAAVLEGAVERWGDGFARVLEHSQVWVNGEEAEADLVVHDGDEVAVIPPVSGGEGPAQSE
jgi:molybdopterin converting factor small subunit